ncbi:MAG: AIR synthase family protein [Candidatus Eisenbacteria bacterium]|nr:AIR synthase family protein [Candidatus Eisenbacteria bacterium]
MHAELPRIGKISAEVFDQVIYPRLGRRRPEVLVGPRHGVDIGIVEIGGGQVMAVTTDPVFIVPPYGWERSAWFAVNILCSDAATSGLPLAYMTIDLNLPRSIAGDEFARMWQTMHEECERLGVAIVTGHTGRYEGCDYPMVGGATVIALGARDAYVTPEMARPGDAILVTKGPAIEAAGLFAATFPGRIAERFGEPFAREAQEIFWQMSVVEEARIAAGVGVRDEGVTAMHDATECGIWGGLAEIASASRVGMIVEKERIPAQEPVVKICEMFGIDPFVSISEGTLLLTARPHKAAEVERRIREAGIPVGIVGEVLAEEKGCRIREGGRSVALEHPRVDPFWEAFGRAAAAAPEKS